jgi:hypothetical protein
MKKKTCGNTVFLNFGFISINLVMLTWHVIVQDGEIILLLWYKDEVFAIENRSPVEGAYTEGLMLNSPRLFSLLLS